MSSPHKNIELLAPAGSFVSLQAAINAGADAVYFGISHLNMRAGSAESFGLDDLAEISRICHRAKIKSYLALNTVVYDQDLKLMRSIIDAVKKNKIDAIIVSDLAPIQYARSIGVCVHCSTQLSISNTEAVRFFSQFADRVVLARELSLEQIHEITQNIRKKKICGPSGNLIEIEVFAHGAMCISVSGRCFMSLFEKNCSANRGVCQQMCRRAYRITDIETGDELRVEDHYVLSPQDLCTIDFIDQMVDAGIMSFKIEGRGRSPEYVSTVVSAYRKALDSVADKKYTSALIKKLMTELKTVYNRGLSKGFLFGRPVGAWSKAYGSKATTRKIFIGKVTHYFAKPQIAEVQMLTGDLKKGDQIYIMGKTTGVLKQKISALRSEDEKPISSASKGDLVTFPVSDRVRLGDQIFIIEKVSSSFVENEKNERLRDRLQK